MTDAIAAFWLIRLEKRAPQLVPRSFGTRVLAVLGPEGLGDATAPGFPVHYRHQLVTPDGSLDILTRAF